MKKKLLLGILTAILAFNQSKAQFNSITDCGANGVGHSTFFINQDTGFVAGEDIGKGVIQRTMDGGNTWTRVYTSAANLEWVEDIFFVNPTTGFAVGVNGSILRTTNGGTTWNRQIVLNVTRFNTVYFPTATVGYAAGVGSPQGPVYKTTDGGINWTAQTSNADSSLRGIFFTDANTGYAFGGYDVLRTTNGGTTWTRSNNTHPNTDPNAEHLEMYCTNASTCYLPGIVIQKTTDGGSTWNTLSMPAIAPPYLYYVTALNFTNALTGFAVGAKVDTANGTVIGAILKTTDAGQNWTNINTTANDDTLQNNRSLSSVKFVNANIGYTTGQKGKMLKTTNAGGITTSVALLNKKADEINIYPNPATGVFTVTFPKTSGQIQIINAIGEIVQTRMIDEQTNSDFQLTGNGIYFIQLINDKQTITKKIVVCK